MRKFEKQRPDSTRLVPVPMFAYEALGGIEKNPQYQLLLSALLGGAVVTEDKVVPTPRGEVTVRMGQVWCSIDTLLEDTFATTGASFTRNQANYAIVKKLEGSGMILESEMVHPETRGVYGKIYTLNPALLDPEQEHVDVVQGYKLFYYGDPREFELGEIVVGNLTDKTKPIRRGRYGKAEIWLNQVAEEGLDTEAFTSIGRWRQGETGDPTKPVRVPYFFIDIDRNDLYRAFLDAMEITYRAEERGYDLNRVYVSFSARRGFHVQISADQVGCPIFTDNNAAKEMAKYVAADLTKGIERDPSVESATALIRATGSKHAGSGMYKTTWTADDFQTLEFHEVMDQAREHRPFTYPDPISDEVEDEAMANFIEMSRHAAINLYERIRMQRASGENPSDGINALIGGVAMGENFHAHHTGRNKAGFILACWLLEGKPTNDEEIDRTAIVEGPAAALRVWNQRNSPPMSYSEVQGRINSAQRRVARQAA